MIGVVNEAGFVCVVVLDSVIFLVFFWSYHVVGGRGGRGLWYAQGVCWIDS